MNEILKRRQRCAVYTRKSSEEGLDQEYNSIDAQRDAGHAYIASQRAEAGFRLQMTTTMEDSRAAAWSGQRFRQHASFRLRITGG